ncbi:hypothetical protein DIZ27_04535 [Streptomyces sp. NWU339]|nr:hypothetical protein DIZ27_04535 [Streptomyces sp. NWU339]
MCLPSTPVIPWPFSLSAASPQVVAAHLYPNVRVESLLVGAAFRRLAVAVSGPMVPPAKFRFLQERSVREPMTPGAAACPP